MQIIIYDNFYNPAAALFAEQATLYLLTQQVDCYIREQSYIRFQQKIDSEHLHIISDSNVGTPDYIISFGGDGTILSAVQEYYALELPIMGFNVGKLGFLAEFSTDYLENELSNLLSGKYNTTTRFAIKAHYNNSTAIALNDIVVYKKNPAKMITLKAFCNGQHIGDYRADGIIISTPTGSTAYSLACGGPILSPDADVVCITPIAPHSLNLRPLVIPSSKALSFITTAPANLIADGFNAATIVDDTPMTIEVANKQVHIIIPQNSNYYDVLREKLLWAKSVEK
ncbi:MAG: NAD(+)/NADH kinase [Ignavibacteria bacterium]|jgi:NAD+ kinase|nr:NAD(+)/NADH kinase [Ignavibacteria bacterium]